MARRGDELYHYGVKGMKWGIRRYQPYPKGHNGGQFLNVDRKTNTKNKGDPYTAYLALWGLAAVSEISVLAGVAIASGVKTSKSRKLQKKCDKEREDATVEKKSGIKTQATKKSDLENVKRVNPAYDDPNVSGAHQNCVNCTMALEMRLRGYEVQAKRRTSGRNGYKQGKDYFNAKTVDIVPEPKYNQEDQHEWLDHYDRQERKVQQIGGNKELAKKGISTIKSFPPGARGQICVSWNRSSGHSMMWRVGPNGEAMIYDGQTGKIYDEKGAYKILTRACDASLQRFDNCKVNYKKIKEAIV